LINRILERYNTKLEGLNSEEASNRLNKYGLNELKEVKKDGPLKLFLSQFVDALIFLLIVASIASYLIGDYLDAIAIVVVVIINSIIGFIQEYRAEKAMKKLKNLVDIEAIVKREGKILKIPSKNLTIGDIVILEEGDKVPADLILIESYDLKIDESALTGESEAVYKNINYENIDDFDSKIHNIKKYSKEENVRDKIVSMDSNVTSGHGTGIVIAIGMETSIGEIATLIQEEKEETPLEKKVDKLGKTIGALAIIVCIGVFFIDFLKGMPIVETFMTAVSLAVAAIPEGLPAVLTLTLALGMQKMAKSQAIVKKLLSVETLGSCTIICSDKTGTLTKNKMTVRETYLKNEEKSILISKLCNNASIKDDEIIGDPTDGACLVFANKNINKIENIRNLKKIKEIPLDSNRKRMTTIYKEIKEDGENIENSNNQENYYILTKGAPELILNLSESIDNNNNIQTITDYDKKEIESKINNMTKSALRVIGLAYRKLNKEEYDNLINSVNINYDLNPENENKFKKGEKSDNTTLKNQDHINKEIELIEQDLIFAGLLGIMDPPREEAKKAVKDCQNAGIKVVMITGDHKDTATAIAKEIGILNMNNDLEDIGKYVLTGEDLEELSDKEYKKIVEDIKVYARVYPEQKRRIVETLQSKDHIVSMTGDGVNDAPALKKATIGVAMGSGTDVAKESADMIIQDDNFATIVGAIKEGRTIYDNLKRFLKFQLSTNIAAILTITSASILPIPTPFTPIQLLWINIIMDGPPAQSLGLEGPEEDIMERSPERGELVGRKTLIKITITGIIMTIGTLALYYYELITSGTNPTTKAITVAFTVFVLYQLFNAYNNKSHSKEKNNMFWISIIGSFILQLFVIYTPQLQIIFKTCPIDIFDWILIFIISGTILVTDKITNKVLT